MSIAETIPESDYDTLKVRMTASDFISIDRSAMKRLYIAQSRPAVLPKYGETLRKAIEGALDDSCGRSLAEAVDVSRPVMLVIDDHTRGTPTSLALEVLYERLRSIGVSDDQMTILVSAGTHRPMNAEEVRSKTGDVGKRLEIVLHDCSDPKGLFLAGKIDEIPVWLNKRLKDAGTVIGIGSVVAHKFSGWSGGAKIICPGLTGYETIYRCHYKSIVEERIVPGQRENWFRSFINRVGDLAGLKFCINFVPTVGGIVGVAAGEPWGTLSRSISLAENAMTACFPEKLDLVMVSSFPATTDLWQSGKGFYIGEMLVRNGGTLVLVTPLDEGLGDHPDFIELLDRKPSDILGLLDSNKLSDPLAAVAAYAIRRIGEHCRLRIVTSNAALHGQPLLGAPITGDLASVVLEAFPSGCGSAAQLNDSYVLPKIVTKA